MYKPIQTRPKAGYVPPLEQLIKYSIITFGLALSCLFFTGSTSAETEQSSFDCTNVTEIPQIECEALVALYNETDGPNWKDTTGWLVTNTPCGWYGVTCAEGHITELELSERLGRRFGLQGDVPPEIGNLTNLTRLELNSNLLSSLPTEIGKLTNLTILSFYNNQLSSLPTEIGKLTNLKSLWLTYNDFSSLPTELWTLTNLTILSIGYNQLGSLPSGIGNLTNLWYLELSDNQLSSLPTELWTLTNLESLGLTGNELSSLPSGIGNLTNLESLELRVNRLSSLPTEIGNFTNLRYLGLYSNQLSSLPTEIGNLTNLTILTLYSNQLSSLPTEIGNLTKLTRLELDCNLLSSQPIELWPLTNLTDLSLAYNRLNISDNDLRSFVAERDPDWADTQTIAPTEVKAKALGESSIELTWTPILFQDKGGYYEISVSDGGPFTVHGTTDSKSTNRYVIEGLTSGTTYRIRIRTYTPDHTCDLLPISNDQLNELWSDYSEVVLITTPVYTPTPTPYPTSTVPMPTPTTTVVSSTPIPTAVPPTTVPPTPTPDGPNLQVSLLEISQSIQTSNASVPLVANRAAIARVFIGVQNANSMGGVTALLHAARNGQELGNSPISPFNSDGQISANSSPSRRNFNHSLNFQLPMEWTTEGQTTFWVEVNPNRTVQEANYEDNRSQNYNIDFHNVAPLEVVLIPIAYQRNGQGPIYRPELKASNNFGLGMLQKIFPVSAIHPRPHAEYVFRGDLKTYDGWSTLLQEIANLRDREQPNAQGGATGMPKYYGLLHNEALSNENIAGLAYRPGTAGIGIIDYDFITPHEIGHNLGLQHVGCGGPVGVDPNYPHPSGTIGHVGLDIMDKNLVSESEHYDLMSYCGPRWISDYHYNKMFTVFSAALGQHTQRRSMAQQDGWLISGRIYPDGRGELHSAEPITSSVIVQEPGSGTYKVELIDGSDSSQFVYSFDPTEIAQESADLQPADFSFIVPQIDDLALIKLWQDNALLAKLDAATSEPELQVSETEGMTHSDPMEFSWRIGGLNARRAITDETTVNVRYSPDQGESWQVLAVGLSSTDFDLSRTQLSASEEGIIELVAVDRNMVSTSQINIGQIENKYPHVGIVLHESQNLYTGEPIMLEGIAMDMEDGTISGDSLVWSSPELGSLGTGNTWIYTEKLAPGEYTIKLTATDSAGNQTEDAVQLIVQADGQRVYLPFVSR